MSMTMEDFGMSFLRLLARDGAITAPVRATRNVCMAKYMDRIGLIQTDSGFCMITDKGRRYLKASEFERAVMEAQRDG